MKLVLIVWVIRVITDVIIKGFKNRNAKTEDVKYNRVMHPAEFALR